MFNGMRMVNRFEDLRREMDRLLDGVGGAVASSTLRTSGHPAVNMWDDGANVFVEAELPGVKRDDLDLNVIGNELTIKGKRPAGATEGGTHHRRERESGEFQRVLMLPVEVDADGIEAKLAHGILTVRLPKAERAKPRRIEINAG